MKSSDRPSIRNSLRFLAYLPISIRVGYVGIKVGKNVLAHCGKLVLETESNGNLIGTCMLGTSTELDGECTHHITKKALCKSPY